MKHNILMLVSGFPTKENPARCIFNYRAAMDLSQYLNLTVVFFRMWKPGRKVYEKLDNYPFKYIILSLPAIPKLVSLKLFSFYFGSSTILRKVIQKVDLIHSVGANSMGIVGSRIAKKFEKPHVAQLIGSDVNSVLYNKGKNYPFLGWENYVDGISANSKAILKVFKTLFPEAKTINTVNYRGVNLDQFNYNDSKFTETLTFLFLGGLPDYKELEFGDNTKGGRTIMKIWKQLDLSNEIDNVRLIFGGPRSDLNEVREWKKTLKKNNNVEIIGNVLPEKVSELMSLAHVILIPSKEEGTPNIGFEALASGMLILGSNVGGIPELVNEKENGWLVNEEKEGFENEYISHIRSIIRKEIDIKSYSESSRRMAEQHFDKKFFTERLLKLFNQLIKKEKI